MTAQRMEYRVVWRRDGAQQATRIYQTKQAAHRKATGIDALERVKDRTRLADMADLTESPVIQERPVGEWTVAEQQPPEPTEKKCEELADYYGVDDGYSGIF